MYKERRNERPKIRFTCDGVYELTTGAYDESNPQFDCLKPAMDDNGRYIVVDCWVTDSQGNIHPGFTVSPVPVSVSNIGAMVRHISS